MGRADFRFAAKEAAYKAFQPDKKVMWKDLEVWKHSTGTPNDVLKRSDEQRETLYTTVERVTKI